MLKKNYYPKFPSLGRSKNWFSGVYLEMMPWRLVQPNYVPVPAFKISADIKNIAP